MPKYEVLSPIKVGGEIIKGGEVELSAKAAAAAVARKELREVKAAKEEKPAK